MAARDRSHRDRPVTTRLPSGRTSTGSIGRQASTAPATDGARRMGRVDGCNCFDLGPVMPHAARTDGRGSPAYAPLARGGTAPGLLARRSRGCTV